MKKTELIFISAMLTVIICIAVYFSIDDYKTEAFWKNILVEVHGMIIDFFLIGVMLSLLLNYQESKKEISDLKRIIDFNRFISSEEAKHKIVTAIKDLNSKKIYDIKLQQCKLNGILMQKIILKSSSIHGTDFSNSNMNGGDLSHLKSEGTKFYGSIIRNCNFSCTKFYRLEMHDSKGKNCDFTQATLIKSNIVNSDLESSDFRQCLINKTNLSNSNLKSVDFRGSEFDEINFSNTNLKNAKFQNCNFKNNITFTNANLSNTNFTGCINLPVQNLILAQSLQGAKFDSNIMIQLQSLGANI